VSFGGRLQTLPGEMEEQGVTMEGFDLWGIAD